MGPLVGRETSSGSFLAGLPGFWLDFGACVGVGFLLTSRSDGEGELLGSHCTVKESEEPWTRTGALEVHQYYNQEKQSA